MGEVIFKLLLIEKKRGKATLIVDISEIKLLFSEK